MHKFILGENPMATNTGGLWIIHLPEPTAIIEVVFEYEQRHSKNAIYKANFEYKNGEAILRYELSVYFLEQNENVIKIVNDAWHWYASYLQKNKK